MLLLLSLHFLLSTSVSFPSKDISSIQGWPHCHSLILMFFIVQQPLWSLTPVNTQPALLWNYTDLGQRLILSHLTKPSLKVCVLLALRAWWFNVESLDMTMHHKQKLLLNNSGSMCTTKGKIFVMIRHQKKFKMGQNLVSGLDGSWSAAFSLLVSFCAWQGRQIHCCCILHVSIKAGPNSHFTKHVQTSELHLMIIKYWQTPRQHFSKFEELPCRIQSLFSWCVETYFLSSVSPCALVI